MLLEICETQFAMSLDILRPQSYCFSKLVRSVRVASHVVVAPSEFKVRRGVVRGDTSRLQISRNRLLALAKITVVNITESSVSQTITGLQSDSFAIGGDRFVK